MKSINAVRYLLIYKQYCNDHNLTDDSPSMTIQQAKEFVMEQIDKDDHESYMDTFSLHSINDSLNKLIS